MPIELAGPVRKLPTEGEYAEGKDKGETKSEIPEVCPRCGAGNPGHEGACNGCELDLTKPYAPEPTDD